MIKEGSVVRRTSCLRLLNGKPFDKVEKVFKITHRNNPSRIAYSVSFANSDTLVKMNDLVEIDQAEQATRQKVFDSIKYMRGVNNDQSACISQKSGENKIKYPGEFQAFHAAFSLSIRDNKSTEWLVYTCGHCGEIHIGNFDSTLKSGE